MQNYTMYMDWKPQYYYNISSSIIYRFITIQLQNHSGFFLEEIDKLILNIFGDTKEYRIFKGYIKISMTY